MTSSTADEWEDVPTPAHNIAKYWLIGGALVVAAAGVAGYKMMQHAPDSYRVETKPGEIRTITLKDGSKIAINGGTGMTLSHDDPHHATLDHGQAQFDIVHDNDHPFHLAIGAPESAGASLVDVGTGFDVIHAEGETIVSVSQGAVAYNPDADNVRLKAGQRLTVSETRHEADVTKIDAATVGGWRTGSLVYEGATLGEAAAELTRTTGVQISLNPETAATPLNGRLHIGTEAAKTVHDLATLSGTHARQDAKGWSLHK